MAVALPYQHVTRKLLIILAAVQFDSASFAMDSLIDLHCETTVKSYFLGGWGFFPQFSQLMQSVCQGLHNAQAPEVVDVGLHHADRIKQHLLVMFGEDSCFLEELAYWHVYCPTQREKLDYLMRRHGMLPFLRTFYLEVLLPKVYQAIEHHWHLRHDRVRAIPLADFETLGQLLMDSVYGFIWPQVFFKQPEDCVVCRKVMFLMRCETRCGHSFHPRCVEDLATCPVCHDPRM